MKCEHFKQSKQLCLELCQAFPSIAEAWLLLGLSLQRMCLNARALEPLKRAFELMPDKAHYIVPYAIALARAGQPQQAEKLFEQAISVAPDNILAYQRLLMVRQLDLEHPYIFKILQIAGDVAQTKADRLHALFALGKHYADHHQYNLAFDYYQHANSLAINDIKPNNNFLNGTFYTDFKQVFYKHFARKNSQQNNLPVVLIAGLPRSGKSLVERLISTHDQIVAGDELAFFKNAVTQQLTELSEQSGKNLIDQLSSIDEQGLLNQYRERLDFLSTEKQANIITDTSPGSLNFITFLPLINPHIPVIFCRRNALDLAISIYFKCFSREQHLYSYDLTVLGETIAAAECLMQHCLENLPNPKLVIDYEQMVRQPAQTAKTIWQFLQLPVEQDLDKLSQQLALSTEQNLHPAHTSNHQMHYQDSLIGISDHYLHRLDGFIQAYQNYHRSWQEKLSASH